MADLMPLGQLSHRDKQILRKSSNHRNVLGAIRVTRSKFHTHDPQILGLEVAQPLVHKFAGSNPAEAVGFLRAKKSSARLPLEGK
jgi:hypothetical protein